MERDSSDDTVTHDGNSVGTEDEEPRVPPDSWAVNYSSEMGGGAPETGSVPPGRAQVRSAYDRSTDEPGSYTEGERPDDDETLT